MLIELRNWWLGLTGDSALAVEYEESPTDLTKRSAWVVIHGPEAVGQLTVWETGECDIEAESSFDGDTIVQEHRQLSDPHEVAAAADALLAVVRIDPR